MKDITESRDGELKSTSERVAFLDSYRALAIIMVVGVHTLGCCYPLPDFQKQVISFIVHTIAVPIFFLVDGYLFARSTLSEKNHSYLMGIKKNIFRLLLPWAIFTSIYIIARFYFESTGFLTTHMIIGQPLSEVIILAYASAIAPQMYFLLSLFLVRLLTPVFRKVVLIRKYGVMLAVFICYYAIYRFGIGLLSPFLHVEGGLEPILHALWGLQFYLMGLILYKTSMLFDLRKLFAPVIFLLIATLLVRSDMELFKHADQYLYLLALFLLFELIGGKLHFLERIGKNTMGIYLLHAPVVLKGVSVISNKFITTPIWSFFSVLSVTFLISYGIAEVINRIPYGSLLFGIPYHSKNKFQHNFTELVSPTIKAQEN